MLPATLPDAAPNRPYSTQLVASGGIGTGYLWSVQAGNLPFGLNLNAQTGVISGTPTQAGVSSNFTIGVRDSGGNSTIRRFSLYVQVAPGLVITSNAPSSFVFIVGDPYTSANSITYLAQGGQTPYTWGATSLPPGLAINAVSGLLYGTPTAPGSFQSEIMVTDSIGEKGALGVVLPVTTTPITISDSSGHTPASPLPGQVGKSYVTFFQAGGGSNAGDHASQPATIVVNSGTPPAISTSTLPTATIGASYSTMLGASGGTPPYHWSFVGASPDPGIQLSQSGTLGGITQNTNDCPTGSSDGLGGLWVGTGYPSTYFQVLVTDAAGQSNSKQLCLVSYYPRPQVSSDTPSSVTIDGGSHTITLNGANFRSTSYIVTNGGGTLLSTYVGPNALSFTLYVGSFYPLCANPNGTNCLDAQTLPQWVIEPYSNISTTSVGLPIYNLTGAFSLPSGTYTLQVTNTHQAGGSNVSVSMTFQVN